MDVKEKKRMVSPVTCLVGVTVLFLLLLSVKRDLQASENSLSDLFRQNVAQELTGSITRKLVPIFSFAQQGVYQKNQMLERQIVDLMPIYGYSREMQEQEYYKEARQEKREENQDTIREEAPLLQQEQSEVTVQEQPQTETEQVTMQENGETLQDLLRAENEAAVNAATFVPHEMQAAVDLQALGSYEALVDTFYTIDANTMAGSDQLDAAKLLSKDLTISKEGEGPQILIYHTHSQEGFADSVPGDVNTTIVGVGEHLSEILQNRYGYQVLHHTGQYDVDTRDDAYSYSLPAIEQVLSENPTIEVVIDLHRDSMPEGTRLVMDLDGRPTARFMFFNGLSRTKNTGDIDYLYNENQEDNLAFSFQMQLKAMEYYPGLTRKIYLKGYRYNMHLRPRTTLIELGAQNNTVEEAMNACDPLAHIIDMVLSKE